MPVAGEVCVAYVHDAEVAYSWHASFLDLVGHDIAHHQRVVRGGWLGMSYGTGGIVEARNKAAQAFVAGRDAEWLWWVDTDMGFAPDTVDRLVAAADPVERPIVGGLCFAWKEVRLDGMGGFRCEARPTIFDMVEDADGGVGLMGRRSYPADELVLCAATGSACLLVHRSVFERIEAKYGPCWYDRALAGTGHLMGEDTSFCVRAAAVGCPTFVHTGVKTTHLKRVWVSEEDFAEVAHGIPG